MASRNASGGTQRAAKYDYLIKLLLIGDSGESWSFWFFYSNKLSVAITSMNVGQTNIHLSAFDSNTTIIISVYDVLFSVCRRG